MQERKTLQLFPAEEGKPGLRSYGFQDDDGIGILKGHLGRCARLLQPLAQRKQVRETFFGQDSRGNTESVNGGCILGAGTQAGLVQRNLDETYKFEAEIYLEKNGAQFDMKLHPPLPGATSPYYHFADAILNDRQPEPSGIESGRLPCTTSVPFGGTFSSEEGVKASLAELRKQRLRLKLMHIHS